MRAAIINIGNELLMGLTLNSNLKWLSSKLDKVGFEVIVGISVRDEENEINKALLLAQEKADIVITTGGLGPTNDDITGESIIKALKLKYTISPDLLKKQKKYYKHVIEKMAYVPEKTSLIQPTNGTAAGWHIIINNKDIFVLPGVPEEMKRMFEEYILPEIKRKTFKKSNKELLRFYGIKEMDIENEIKRKNIEYGILPKKDFVDLYIKTTSEEDERIIDYLKKKFSNNYIGDESSSLEEIIQNILIKNNKTICCAESVTGGLISEKLTRIPGSSKILLGSVITYSDKSKVNLLNIDRSVIKRQGAVSEEVVKQMALGVLELFDADYSISTTGIAGPKGATKNKPVGLNYIGFAKKGDVKTKKVVLKGRREVIKNRVANASLNFALEEIC